MFIISDQTLQTGRLPVVENVEEVDASKQTAIFLDAVCCTFTC